MRKFNSHQIIMFEEGEWVRENIIIKLYDLLDFGNVISKDGNIQFKNINKFVDLHKNEILDLTEDSSIYLRINIMLVDYILDRFYKINPNAYEMAHLLSNYVNSQIIKNYKLPILYINNPLVISMLEDTDINTDLDLNDIKIPYSNFFLKFNYKNNIIELFIQSNAIMLKSIYGIGLYEDGGGDNSSSLKMSLYGNNFIPLARKGEDNHRLYEDVINAKELVKKLLYFFSIEKNINYIHKSVNTNNKSRLNLKEKKYLVKIIHLFEETKYKYEYSNSNKNETSIEKVAHLVRGHFRKQPYGTRDNPEYKIIWIQPYFTNGNIDYNSEYRIEK